MNADKQGGKCSVCGAVLPSNPPGGHCPICMLRLAMRPPNASSKTNDSAYKGFENDGLEMRGGDLVGRYRICEKLGEGGCGLVFRAKQEEPFRREVALKILKPGLDTRQIIARFEAERQALALLEHPGIARVFDGGVASSGRPYFVMELVRGSKITTHAEERRMELAGRLDLFVQVCRAISHAHGKGIIHRDIKPANVLVTTDAAGCGELPKVIDFGLSKSLEQPLGDKTVYTSLRQFIGTPAYMSPEQAGLAGGQIDARTDVYSLGVLLHELLTGEVPLADSVLSNKGTDILLKAIRETDPMLPSARLASLSLGKLAKFAAARRIETPSDFIAQVKGDLDWIVMKCLEKEPIRRYQTVEELIGDIEAFLHSKPIRAGDPGWAYRLGKSMKRRQGALRAGLVIGLVMLAGLGIGLSQHWRARKAEMQRDKFAETNFRKMRAAGIAEGRSKVQEDLLDSLVKNWSASGTVKGESPVGSIEKLLNESFVRMESQPSSDPAVHAEMLETFAEAYYRIGNYPAVETILSRALKIGFPGDDSIESLAKARSAWNLLGNALYREKKVDAAKASFAKALSLNNPSVSVPQTEGGANVSALASKDETASANKIAESLASIGCIHLMQGNNSAAADFFQEGIDVETNTAEPDLTLLAALHGNKAGVLSAVGELEAAISEAKESVRIYRAILPEQPEGVSKALSNLGELFRRAGRFAEAEQADREVVDLASATHQSAFEMISYSGCLKRLAIDLSKQQKTIEAGKYFSESTKWENLGRGSEVTPKPSDTKIVKTGTHPLYGIRPDPH